MLGSMRDVCATISSLHTQLTHYLSPHELTLLTLSTQCIEATQQEDLGGLILTDMTIFGQASVPRHLQIPDVSTLTDGWDFSSSTIPVPLFLPAPSSNVPSTLLSGQRTNTGVVIG